MIKTIDTTNETEFDYRTYDSDGFYVSNNIDIGRKYIVLVFYGVVIGLFFDPPQTQIKDFEILIDGLAKTIEVEKIIEVEKPVYIGGVSESTLLKAIALAQTPSAIKEIDV